MSTNYNVDYFIKKFEAIPEGEWFKGEYVDCGGSAKCALGHCGARNDKETNDETTNLFELFSLLQCVVHIVNDGNDFHYKQPTPKQRILAALYDIKKMQQPEWKDITSDLAVLPVNETSDLINHLQTIQP